MNDPLFKRQVSGWLDENRDRRDGVTIPRIWLAILASVLVHLATLWTLLPRLHFPTMDDARRGQTNGSLVVQLEKPSPPASARPPSPPAPPAQAQNVPAPKAQPAPAAPARRSPSPPKAAPRPQSAPPVLALNKSAPDTPARSPSTPSIATPPPARPPTPAPAPPSPAPDFASYVAARQQARGQPAPAPAAAAPSPPEDKPPEEDQNERSRRIVAANLGTERAPTYGSQPVSGGGIFQLKRLGYSDAEFVFFGWNRDIRRNTTQLVEVQKGNNSDIRIAVVRKMIAIIREYEQEDFLWESKRLGRNLTLSARAKDNAGLEEFLMREFFYDVRSP